MINKDYAYCTGLDCSIRGSCKRYNKEALECHEPLWWMDVFYDDKTGKCDFMDEKE